jgi:hypothetical protein
MSYVRLGRAPAMISRVIAGCSGLRSHEAESAEPGPVAAALARGINLFDVSHRAAEAEIALARALAAEANRAWICVKICPFADSPEVEAAKFDGGTVQAFWDALHSALARLQTDHLDLCMLESVDAPWRMADDPLFEALRSAKDQGKIRWFGIETHRNIEAVVNAAIDTGLFDLFQFPLNPLTLPALEPIVDRLRECDLAIAGTHTSAGLERPAALDLRELPAEWNTEQLALVYMMKRVPEAAFVVEMDSAAALERAAPLAKYEPTINEYNELYAAVENELWPLCAGCSRRRMPAMRCMEAVFEADLRAVSPMRARAARPDEIAFFDATGLPLLYCDRCLGALQSGADSAAADDAGREPGAEPGD